MNNYTFDHDNINPRNVERNQISRQNRLNRVLRHDTKSQHQQSNSLYIKKHKKKQTQQSQIKLGFVLITANFIFASFTLS